MVKKNKKKQGLPQEAISFSKRNSIIKLIMVRRLKTFKYLDNLLIMNKCKSPNVIILELRDYAHNMYHEIRRWLIFQHY